MIILNSKNQVEKKEWCKIVPQLKHMNNSYKH